MTVALVAIGVGFTIGNSIAGRLADRLLSGTLIGFLLVIALTSFLLPLAMHTRVTAVIGSWREAPPVQTLVMRRAAEAPGLASSVNIDAFNVGNAICAATGGLVLSTGLGYAAIPQAGAVLALLGDGLALLAARAMRSSPASPA